jgi:hypothetical protein
MRRFANAHLNVSAADAAKDWVRPEAAFHTGAMTVVCKASRGGSAF